MGQTKRILKMAGGSADSGFTGLLEYSRYDLARQTKVACRKFLQRRADTTHQSLLLCCHQNARQTSMRQTVGSCMRTT